MLNTTMIYRRIRGAVGRRAVVGLLACAALAGCARPQRAEQAQQGEQADVDAFLHEHLQRQPMVTVGEAYRAVLLLADGEETLTTFEEREAALLQRGVVRQAWKLRREEPIDKATVAYMVMRVAGVPAGVNSALLGGVGLGDRRYALRDLMYEGLMEPASAYRYITGGELVEVMARADRYMAAHGRYSTEEVDIGQMLGVNEGQPAE